MALETVDTAQYQSQLDTKAKSMQERFAALGDWDNSAIWQVFASQPKNYRMRAEFRLWHDDD